MKNINIVGIDISKDTFDCTFLVNNVVHYNTFSQTQSGYENFLSTFQMFDIDVVGFESTGRYHKTFEKYLRGNGVNPLILDPRSVSHFIKSTQIKGKTDKGDSYGIALYISKNSDLVSLDYPTRDKFKPLIATLAQYEKQLIQFGNLLKSFDGISDDLALKLSVETCILQFEKQRDELRVHAIKELYRTIPEAELIEKEIKGVGKIVLLYVLPMIYDHFDKFTMKQIVSFFGVVPVPFQSGSSVLKRSHISYRGDVNSRKVLFMASMPCRRFNPIFKEKYDRLIAKGKTPKVAQVAIIPNIIRAIVSRLSHHTGRPVKK